jgi:hypothetical protein
MRHLLFVLAFAGCATTGDSSNDFTPGGIPDPTGAGGKGDSDIQCGASTCAGNLCGWDCSAAGQACTEACTTDGRANVYVTAQAGSDSVDSRQTPYKPKYALDNVLIYGCEIWHFADGSQGLEIQYDELIHSSFTVDPSDPARYQRKLDVYAGRFAGAGDYKAEAMFVHSSDADAAGERYVTHDGCTVHAAAADGGLAGTFSCSLATQSGATTSMSGQFACPGSGTAGADFIAWTPAS